MSLKEKIQRLKEILRGIGTADIAPSSEATSNNGTISQVVLQNNESSSKQPPFRTPNPIKKLTEQQLCHERDFINLFINVESLQKLITNLNLEIEKLKIENFQLQKTVSKQEADFKSYEKLLRENDEINLKYAEKMGHQNRKQKIKYLKNLKMKNIQLDCENKKLQKKIQSLTKKLNDK